MLHPCNVTKRALCGSIQRQWEPGDPSQGKLRVGFAFVPAKHGPAVGTLVPHEGGPGYSTTGSVDYFTGMYRHLLDHRNLLLVDQRGTGRSAALDCPDLQNLHDRVRRGRRVGADAASAIAPTTTRPRCPLTTSPLSLDALRLDSSTSTATPTARSSSRSSPAAIPTWSAASSRTAPTRRTARPAGTPRRDRR